MGVCCTRQWSRVRPVTIAPGDMGVCCTRQWRMVRPVTIAWGILGCVAQALQHRHHFRTGNPIFIHYLKLKSIYHFSSDIKQLAKCLPSSNQICLKTYPQRPEHSRMAIWGEYPQTVEGYKWKILLVFWWKWQILLVLRNRNVLVVLCHFNETLVEFSLKLVIFPLFLLAKQL